MKLAILLLASFLLDRTYGIDLEILDAHGNVRQSTVLDSVHCPPYVANMPGMWRSVTGQFTLERCAIHCLQRANLAIQHDRSRNVCTCAKSVDTSRCSNTTRNDYMKLHVLAPKTLIPIANEGGAISVRGGGGDLSCATISSSVSAAGDSSQSCSARCYKSSRYAVEQSSGCACADDLPGHCTWASHLSTSSARVFVVNRHVVVPRIARTVVVVVVGGGGGGKRRDSSVSKPASYGGSIDPVWISAVSNGSSLSFPSPSSSLRVSFAPPQLSYSRRALSYRLLLSRDQSDRGSGSGSQSRGGAADAQRDQWTASTRRHHLTLTSATRAAPLAASSRVSALYNAVMQETPGVQMRKVWFMSNSAEAKSAKTHTAEVTGYFEADGSIRVSWPVMKSLPSPSNSLYYTTMYVYKFSVRATGGAGGAQWRLAASQSSPRPLQVHTFATELSVAGTSLPVRVEASVQKLWKMFEVPEKQLRVSIENGAIAVNWLAIASLPAVHRYRYLFYYWPAQQPQATPTLVVRESSVPLQSVSLGADGTVDTALQYRVRAVIVFLQADSHTHLVDPTTVKLSGSQLTWSLPSTLTDPSSSPSPNSRHVYRVRVVVSRLSAGRAARVPLDDRLVDQLPSSLQLAPAAVQQLQQLQQLPYRVLVYVRRMPSVLPAKSIPMQALLTMPRLELPESHVHVVYRSGGQRLLVQFQPISVDQPSPAPAYYLIYYTPLVGSPADVTLWSSKLVALPANRQTASADGEWWSGSPGHGSRGLGSAAGGRRPSQRSVSVQLPSTDASQPYLVKVFHIPARPAGFILASGRQMAGGSPGSFQIQWQLPSPLPSPSAAAAATASAVYGVFVWSGGATGGATAAQPRFLRAVTVPHEQLVAGGMVTTEVSGVRVAPDAPVAFLVAPLPSREVIGGVQFVSGALVHGAPNRRYITWSVRDTSAVSYSIHRVSTTAAAEAAAAGGDNGRVKYLRTVTLNGGRISEGQRISSYVYLPSGGATSSGGSRNGTVGVDTDSLFMVVPVLRLPKVAGTRLVDLKSVTSRSAPLQWSVSPAAAATASYTVLAPPTNDDDSSGEPRPLAAVSPNAPSVGSRVSARQVGAGWSDQSTVIVYALHSQPLGGGVRFVLSSPVAGHASRRRLSFRLPSGLLRRQYQTYAVYLLLPQQLPANTNNINNNNNNKSNKGNSSSSRSDGAIVDGQPLFVQLAVANDGSGSGSGDRVSIDVTVNKQLLAAATGAAGGAAAGGAAAGGAAAAAAGGGVDWSRAVFLVQPVATRPELGEPMITWAEPVPSQPTNYQLKWPVRDASVTTYSIFALSPRTSAAAAAAIASRSTATAAVAGPSGVPAATAAAAGQSSDLSSDGARSVTDWQLPRLDYITSLTLSGSPTEGAEISSKVTAATAVDAVSGSAADSGFGTGGGRRLFLIVPVSATPLVAGTEISWAERSGDNLQTSWTVKDQTVKRYFVFATSLSQATTSFSPTSSSSRSSPLVAGRPYFVHQQLAPTNPSAGSVVTARVTPVPSAVNVSSALLVYPVPNQLTMTDGAACVLGSDYYYTQQQQQQQGGGGSYAVRWLVTNARYRWYAMFAVLPGRRPQLARFVDLGEQPISAGTSRTDYVTSLMPGVHYTFLVLPVTDGARVDQVADSRVTFTVPAGAGSADYFALLATPSGQQMRLLAVVPAVHERQDVSATSSSSGHTTDGDAQSPNGARAARPGDQLTVTISQPAAAATLTSPDRVTVLPLYTQHQLTDWPIIDGGVSGDGAVPVVGSRSDPLPAPAPALERAHAVRASRQRVSDTVLRLTWSSPQPSATAAASSTDAARTLFLVVYRVPSLAAAAAAGGNSTDATSGQWQFVARLSPKEVGASSATDTATVDLQVTADAAGDAAEYVVAYMTAASGVSLATVTGSSASGDSAAAVDITWPSVDARVTRYSVFVGSRHSPLHLLQVYSTNSGDATAPAPSTAPAPADVSSRSSSRSAQQPPSMLSSRVNMQQLQQLLGSEAERLQQLVAVVAEERPHTHAGAFQMAEPAPRISWTVDTRDVLGYAVFVHYKDGVAPQLNQMVSVPVPAPGTTALGTTLTTLLQQLRPGVEYRYFVVPVYRSPSTSGTAVPSTPTSRSIVWQLPTEQVSHYAVFGVSSEAAELLQLVPAATAVADNTTTTTVTAAAGGGGAAAVGGGVKTSATQSVVVSAVSSRSTAVWSQFVVLGLPATPADPPVRVQYPAAEPAVQSSTTTQSRSHALRLNNSSDLFKPLSLLRGGRRDVVKHFVQITAPDTHTTYGTITANTTVSTSATVGLQLTVEQVSVRVARATDGQVLLSWPRVSAPSGHRLVYVSVYGDRSGDSGGDVLGAGRQLIAQLVPTAGVDDVTRATVSAADSANISQYYVYMVFAPIGVEMVRGEPVTGHADWRRVVWSAHVGATGYQVYVVRGARQPLLVHSAGAGTGDNATSTTTAAGATAGQLSAIIQDMLPGETYYFLVYYVGVSLTNTQTGSGGSVSMRLTVRNTAVHDYGIFFLPPGHTVPHYDQLYHVTGDVTAGDVISVPLQSRHVTTSTGYQFFAAPLPTASNAVGQTVNGAVRVFYTLLPGYTQYALFVRNISGSSDSSDSQLTFVTVVMAGSQPISGRRVTFSVTQLTNADNKRFYLAPLLLPSDRCNVFHLSFAVPVHSAASRYAILYRHVATDTASASRVGLLAVLDSPANSEGPLTAHVQGLANSGDYQFYRVAVPATANANGVVVGSGGGVSQYRVSYQVDQPGASRFAVFCQSTTTSDDTTVTAAAAAASQAASFQFLAFIEAGATAVPVGATLETQVDGLATGDQQAFYVLPVRLDSSEAITNVRVEKLSC